MTNNDSLTNASSQPSEHASKIRIAVVGATGPTGQLVVQQAIEQGHRVAVYARRPNAVPPHSLLTVLGGELDDLQAFAQAITGCDVLICTLGSRSWRERDFMTLHLPMVTRAMQTAGVKRLVLMSALGGGDVPAKTRGLQRLVYKFLSRVIFSDRTTSETDLAATGLVWSAVYPGFLETAPVTQKFVTAPLDQVRKVKGGRIPRAAVASVLLELAENPTTDGSRLAIAREGGIVL